METVCSVVLDQQHRMFCPLRAWTSSEPPPGKNPTVIHAKYRRPSSLVKPLQRPTSALLVLPPRLSPRTSEVVRRGRGGRRPAWVASVNKLSRTPQKKTGGQPHQLATAASKTCTAATRRKVHGFGGCCVCVCVF